jgi:hypothetical protein
MVTAAHSRVAQRCCEMSRREEEGGGGGKREGEVHILKGRSGVRI